MWSDRILGRSNKRASISCFRLFVRGKYVNFLALKGARVSFISNKRNQISSPIRCFPENCWLLSFKVYSFPDNGFSMEFLTFCLSVDIAWRYSTSIPLFFSGIAKTCEPAKNLKRGNVRARSCGSPTLATRWNHPMVWHSKYKWKKRTNKLTN